MLSEGTPSGLSRREFISRAACAAVGGVALAAGGGASGAQEAPASRIVLRRLGRTNVRISHIVAAWDWNEWLYPDAVAAGINYWHKIAGWAELPEVLRKLDRETWYCDVVLDTLDQDGAYEQFEWARKSLGLAYVDAIKLSSLYQRPEDVKEKTGFLRAFDRLKAEKKVRHLAAAQHGGDIAAICAAMIESGWFDHLQPAVSVAPTPAMVQMLSLAQKHDVGIITKKTMGAVARARQDAELRAEVEKHLGKDGKWGAAVIKTMLAVPGVTAVTPRTETFEQFVDNLSPGGIEPTPRESAAVEAIRRFARAEVCSYCGTCLGACPQGLAIPSILRFATYSTAYGCAHQARRLYAGLAPEQRADRCRDCGSCEKACPQGMEVRRKLREAARIL